MSDKSKIITTGYVLPLTYQAHDLIVAILHAERRALKQRLGDIEIEAMHIEYRLDVIERDLKDV